MGWIHGFNYFRRKYHYWALFVSQIFLIFLSAFMEDSLPLAILFIISIFWIYGSLIVSLWQRRLPRLLLVVVGTIAVMAAVLLVLPHMPREVHDVAAAVASFAFGAVLIIACVGIAAHIFQAKHVGTQVIVGAASLYLLFGLCFAFIYAGVDILGPAAFNFSDQGVVRIQDFRDHVYFSFTTLTTTGFGDVLAMTPLARVLAVFEMILGSIYLAFMVACLVGVHTAQAARNKVAQLRREEA